MTWSIHKVLVLGGFEVFGSLCLLLEQIAQLSAVAVLVLGQRHCWLQPLRGILGNSRPEDSLCVVMSQHSLSLLRSDPCPAWGNVCPGVQSQTHSPLTGA